MSAKELREKYQAASAKKAIARAIRAEIAGGEDLLKELTAAFHRANHQGWWTEFSHRRVVPSNAAVAHEVARKKVEAVENEIRSRYGMPPTTNQAAWFKNKKRAEAAAK